MQPCDPTAETLTAKTNRLFITRWNRLRASREVQLFGRLRSDIRNVHLYFPAGVRLQIRLKKSRPNFYVVNKSVDPKTVFKFLDAQLLVRRVRSNPALLLPHNSTLKKWSFARYNLTRFR